MQTVIRLCDRLAPPKLAVEGDNIGLIIGNPKTRVKGVTVALDVTHRAIDHALEKGCNMMVVHHPIIYNPIRKIDTSTANGSLIERLIKNDIALFAMHTNLDSAPMGLNHTVARLIGLKRVGAVPCGGIVYRIGRLGKPVTPGTFALDVKMKLGLKSVRLYGGNRKISKIAVCTGAGADFLADAVSRGADALVTGDVRHHNAIEAETLGVTLIDAGHHGTERPMVKLVTGYLKKNLVKSSKRIRISGFDADEIYRTL